MGVKLVLPTLRVERSLRVVENRVGRKKFGPKREGVTGEWRRLHNEVLKHLYSDIQIKKEAGSACSMNGGDESFLQGSGG